MATNSNAICLFSLSAGPVLLAEKRAKARMDTHLAHRSTLKSLDCSNLLPPACHSEKMEVPCNDPALKEHRTVCFLAFDGHCYMYRAVKRVLERQAARVLYRGEARQTLPPIQEWRRFDAADVQPGLCGRRGASSREPQGGHQQPGAVLRAEAGHQDPRAAAKAQGAAEDNVIWPPHSPLAVHLRLAGLHHVLLPVGPASRWPLTDS